MREITLIIPYYRAPMMLREQLKVIDQYPDGVKVIVVDDCSPEPAREALRDRPNLSLYRIDTDIPWNRGGARNLGVTFADTEWIVHVDIDHILPATCAENLLTAKLYPQCWYRFPRYRVGKADETRKKDTIPPDQTFGSIKPHIDSYACTKDLYWEAGGYNEDYSGCLGGGSPFLEQLGKVGELRQLPPEIHLHVYTRDRVPDASVSDLSRDTSEYARRKAKIGSVKGKNPLRFDWHRVF
jgi:glycosyltransferase involved in cell wall biosynthesis